jgi:hypothetical protein
MSLDSVARRDEVGGKPVASDNISNYQYQLLKLTLGTIGANDGPVSSTNPMPVTSRGTSLTASASSAVTVGVASGLALAANISRKGLYLTNTHTTNRISIAFGSTAVLDSGITIFSKQTFWMDEFSFSTALINAIASGASTNLAIQEFV